MMIDSPDRRHAMILVLAGAGALAACAHKDDDGGNVSATEDLVREHGVLSRLLAVYREAALHLRAGTVFDAGALAEAATLFRTFGEDYHEHKLEEQHIFPAVAKAGGAAASLVPILLAQHQRGREINEFVIWRSQTGKITSSEATTGAYALHSFARMYEEHAALEDTVIFRAWRKALSPLALEAGDLFEQIEMDQFKGDGFDLAVAEVARIERRLGLIDLGHFTAPMPLAAGF